MGSVERILGYLVVLNLVHGFSSILLLSGSAAGGYTASRLCTAQDLTRSGCNTTLLWSDTTGDCGWGDRLLATGRHRIQPSVQRRLSIRRERTRRAAARLVVSRLCSSAGCRVVVSRSSR